MKHGTWMITMAMLAVAATAASAQTSSQFFASQVVRYSPGVGNDGFSNTQLVLGGPQGGGTGYGSLHVVTLGVQGELVLGFDANQTLTNGAGADLVVFENAIGTATSTFAELVRVGVSSNGTDFAYFPTWCGVTSPVSSYGRIDPHQVSGFAGVNPVLANVATNSISPFDPAASGGDAFDLSALSADALVQSGQVNLNAIRYVLLKDVLGDGSEHDSSGNPIYDATGFMQPPYNMATSADIDAIAVIHGLVATAHPGDANNDGRVNVVDLGVLAKYYDTAGGATWEMADFSGEGKVDVVDLGVLAKNYDWVGTPGTASVPEPGTAAFLTMGALALLRRSTRKWRFVRPRYAGAGPATITLLLACAAAAGRRKRN